MNGIFMHGLGSKKLFWKSHERGSYRVAVGLFKGKFCTRCHIWVPNLEKLCERHFLSMDWVEKSYVGRATKKLVIGEFLRVLCFRVAFGRF